MDVDAAYSDPGMIYIRVGDNLGFFIYIGCLADFLFVY